MSPTGPTQPTNQVRSRAHALGLVLVGMMAAWSCARVHAHEGAPGVLGLEEQADGRYLIAWSAPIDTRIASAEDVTPRFPSHCVREGALLDCGPEGLHGELTIEGLEGRLRVAVFLTRRAAPPLDAMLDAQHPRLPLDRSSGSALRWLALGAEHVLLGLDHLAFLLGLLLVSRLEEPAGRVKRLLLTVTAFTVAHSITLGVAVLDLVRPSSALVEALIALSVLLVAREGLSVDREASPWSVRRAPAAIAAFFGLVHGLGLAGVLRETALPRDALVPALFAFNVGVELGQLAFIGAALLVAQGLAGHRWTPRARTTLVYVVGCAAAYWFVVRAAAIVVRL